MNKRILSAVWLVTGFALGATALSTLAAWTSAPASPPNNNTAAPLNVSLNSQDKEGPLRINTSLTPATYGLNVWGISKFWGGLVIETRAGDPASPETGRMWLRTDI